MVGDQRRLGGSSWVTTELTIRALILAKLVNELELFERLDDVDVLAVVIVQEGQPPAVYRKLREPIAPKVLNDVLATGVQAIVEQRERLEDMPPVLALVVLQRWRRGQPKLSSGREPALRPTRRLSSISIISTKSLLRGRGVGQLRFASLHGLSSLGSSRCVAGCAHSSRAMQARPAVTSKGAAATRGSVETLTD